MMDPTLTVAEDATRAIYERAASSSGGNAGSHRGSQGSSVSAMLSTLIPVFIIASVIFILFLIFRRKFERVYQPRTFIGSLRNWQRSPKQSTGILGWRKEYSQLKDEFVLGHASLDNYLWVRYFRILAGLCFFGCIITWPILFPVNATGGGGQNGLDLLSFSNVNPGPRYYAQVFVAWIFLSFVMFVLTREAKFFIRLRQQYYLSPYERSKISTRSILFTNVPEEFRNEERLRSEFSLVRAVWLVNVPEGLAEKVDDRDTAAAKLETGEVTLIGDYIKKQNKAAKKGQAEAPKQNPDGTPAAIEISKKDRPTHRLPVLKFLPLGKKVDTLDWSRGELRRLIPEVAQEQNDLRSDRSKAQGACFVEFETVAAAYTAYQKATGAKKSKSKSKMTPKELGPVPDDVLWKNIIKPASKTRTINILCTAFVWFLCIFWTIPVAVIGAITNINYLTNEVGFLSFINDIPSVILGVVTGLLPTILLSVLMALVPIICGIMAGLFEPTTGSVALRVQSWYFPFQVIQVFLVTTFASGASSVASQIVQNPSSAVTLLAKNLPKASNFYIAYFILFGLIQAMLQLLNIVPLLIIVFLSKILDKTPRKMYNRYVTLAGVNWGSFYPKFTNLGVIALAYSSIAPLVLGFATVGFFILYLAFRYNTLFTLGITAHTRGECYLRALKQLTVGIYLSEVCLIGLFAIGIGNTNQSIGPLVLMVAFLVATVVWHVMILNRSLKKLSMDLPEETLADRLPESNGEAENGHSQMEKHDGPKDGGPDSFEGYHMKNDNPSPSGKESMMGRIRGYFAPEKSAMAVIHAIAPHLSQPVRQLTQNEHDEAYLHPAILSECPIVWIARDQYGLSRQEIMTSRKEIGEGIEMTDEGADYNEKGKVQWNSNDLKQAPVWEDEPVY